jgi:hypothetical protein
MRPVISVSVVERGNRKGGGVMEGIEEIDKLMRPVLTAIKRHVKDEDAITEIYNRTYEAIIESMDVNGKRIADLESENARITELALDQADKAIKSIGELEAALQYERNFPSHGVERRRIV